MVKYKLIDFTGDFMRYAIFDFDGTLIDSMTMWRNMGNLFLEKNNFL